MISIKSIINFVKMNTYGISLSVLSYFINNNISKLNVNIYIKLLLMCLVFTGRNLFVVKTMEYLVKDKELANNNAIISKEEYKFEFMFNLIRSSFIEAITQFSILHYFNIIPTNYKLNLLHFVPKSFVFEVIFDFFHYISHRLIHSNRFLYRNIHKHHHKHIALKPILTFYQSPLDIILSNSIPLIATTALSLQMFTLSPFELSLISTYKVLIEVAGHTGRKSYPTASFFQFMWLPKLLHIESYTETHDKHHSLNNCNYSKRFSLWDKVFGTFK